MRKIVVHIILLALNITALAQDSVLKEGRWFKVSVEHDGVFRLSSEHFNRMGFGNIDPRQIRIFGYPGGMLPQSNDAPRPGDLVELAIQVAGESDGSLDADDYVIFFGQGPDGKRFLAGKNVFSIESNLYSDKNYYFITVGPLNGKRIPIDEAGSGGTPVTTFHDFVFHEENLVNILSSGREWFGENFELNPQHVFEFDVTGIADNSIIKVISEVMAQSYNPSSFQISFNGTPIGEQSPPVMPDSQYGAKGRIARDTLSLNAATVNAAQQSRQIITYNFKRAASRKSTGFLNYFSLHFERKLQLSANQVIFRNGNARNMASRFIIQQVSPNEQIWNVSDPTAPRQQNFSLETSTASFSANAGAVPDEYIVFGNEIPSPELIGPVANQNLRGMPAPDLLIVTHPDLAAEANRLADHRRSHNNYAVEVVTTEQIYNEFSSGRQDVTAIRDFARSLYRKNSGKLKSLLAFGKTTYDYLARVQGSKNLVPTYGSRNSLSPLETYSSDDYFGFLEDSEGEWAESIFESHSLDIGVGRIPVKTPDEARVVVDKLIQYDQDSRAVGRWRKDIVFVADDGSTSDGFSSVHQSQANSMAEEIENNHLEFNTRKIFLGAYTKNVSPNGETIPNANLDILEEFSEALIINYTGHGSEKLWADEHVFTPADIERLRNKTFPFLVTATCEFGRHDDPADVSAAEISLLKPEGGCIGLVTTARPVNSSTNYELNQAFYSALFQQEDREWLTLGEIFRRTKNNSTSGVANRNFSLLGDPSMTLALPLRKMVVDQIKTELGSDTLKALSKVVVKGRVLRDDNETDTGFNGVTEATLFDKRTRFQTIGKNNPAFKYSQWLNPLFRGKASVHDGVFEFSFFLPKNIAYEINTGKLSLYAYPDDGHHDASGASNTFKIGGSETDPLVDNVPPEIEVFMGDTTFIDGGTVSNNSTLVVKLKDESGINISSYGIGNTMMAVLDDDQEVFLINEHYVANRDDFTQGWVDYPLYNLSPGEHTLTVKAWDTHNNPAEKTIRFDVSPGNSIAIEDLGNYPNPFATETTLFFTHNRPGEDLQVHLTIISPTGMEIRTYDKVIAGSPYKVDLLKFNDQNGLGKKLSPGLYFARLKIRSVTDGSESMRVSKLILAN